MIVSEFIVHNVIVETVPKAESPREGVELIIQ